MSGIDGTSIDRVRAIDSVPASVSAKGSMDTIYPWWMDEREFPRRAVITEWFYNPLKGQPRYVDIYRLRALAASEWVWMCTSTIIEEVAQIPWEIVPKDPKLKEDPPELLLRQIDEVDYFLKNPNDNKEETINMIIRAALRDSLEIDSFCLVKGFSGRSYMRHPAGGFELKPQGQRELVEIFARDGGSFLKETDVNGINYRYWQYSYLHPAVAPIEFDVNEVIYASRYPRSYSVYGWGELQSMETILNCLINSAYTNATIFQEYAVPSGVVSFNGTKEDEDRLREYWRTEIKGRFHKVAVLNKEAKFVPLAYTNRDLEFFNMQQWFSKLVWALYKLTPTELGFQDEIRETGKAMASQGKIQKRKSVMPLLRLIEQIMNFQVIPEFSPYLEFKFNFVDKEEEYADTQLEMDKIMKGMVTINDWRHKTKTGPNVPWGDQPLEITLAQLKAASAKPPGMPSEQPSQAPGQQTSPGQAALREMTAEDKGLIEATKAWGARPVQSWDFLDRADRAAPVYTYDDKTGTLRQEADTTLHPQGFAEDFQPSKRGPYAGAAKPVPYPMGAMGTRPDEPGPRDGMMLGGENPEEIQRLRDGLAHASGMGAHKWERDETERTTAMNTNVDPVARDQLSPARRVTDPVTDPESRIVPTPLVRADDQHPKGKRNVPPLAGATGSSRKKPRRILGATGVSGPERESLGYLDKPEQSGRFKALGAQDHGHADTFRGGIQAERGVHRKLSAILKAFLNGHLTRDQAVLEGRKAIDEHNAAVLEVVRKQAARVMQKDVIELPPEIVTRYAILRTQALGDFQRILDDGERNKSPILKMVPPIPSKAGGKRREANFLKTLIPQHSLYVEPFAGGGSPILHARSTRKRRSKRRQSKIH